MTALLEPARNTARIQAEAVLRQAGAGSSMQLGAPLSRAAEHLASTICLIPHSLIHDSVLGALICCGSAGLSPTDTEAAPHRRGNDGGAALDTC